MATWLNEYKELKGGIAQQANGGQMALEQLMLHQELLYRIEVLEACQTLCKTAPITTDLQAMSGHYKLVDAYICCMAKERRFGQPADDNLKAKLENGCGGVGKDGGRLPQAFFQLRTGSAGALWEKHFCLD